MAKFNDIFVFDWSVFLDLFFNGGKDNPMVVGVVEGVTSDLLALRGDTAIVVAEGIAIDMGMKICFCVFVHYGDSVVIVDIAGLTCHWIIVKSRLEVRGHEIVPWTGTCKDRKVQPEPKEIEDEREDDQSKESSSKVATEFSLLNQRHFERGIRLAVHDGNRVDSKDPRRRPRRW